MIGEQVNSSGPITIYILTTKKYNFIAKTPKIIDWNDYLSKTKNTRLIKLVSFKGEKRAN